jgi:hypothetical protein
MWWSAMANLEINGADLSIHSRGSYRDAFKISDGADGFEDISALTLFFEVDGIPIRELLDPDPLDRTTQWLTLERTQVETLTTSYLPYSIVDETDMADDLPIVLVSGQIKRHGYKGLPDGKQG